MDEKVSFFKDKNKNNFTTTTLEPTIKMITNCKQNTNQIFSTMRSLFQGKQKLTLKYYLTLLLSIIFDKSFNKGKLPQNWKDTIISSSHKRGGGA